MGEAATRRGRLPPERGSLTPRAVAFDFNGTISDDESVYCEIFRSLFAARGRPLAREDYFRELVGLPDAEIVRRWLGDDCSDVDGLLAERRRVYRELTASGESVPRRAREALRAAAARVPVAIVSGDFRDEIEHVLAGAGLAALVSALVALEDVSCPKPDPEAYLLALERLGGLPPGQVVAIEDTEVGVASAKVLGCTPSPSSARCPRNASARRTRSPSGSTSSSFGACSPTARSNQRVTTS